MNIKDMALYYRRCGLMPIPVKEKSSIVKWKEYQEKIASEHTIRDWFEQNPHAGLALLTGPISNTIVLDLDGPQALEQVKNFPFPKTWIAKTRKGYHYYFKWDVSINISTTITKLNGMEGVDIRGYGGYVVAPPSYGVYSWLPGYAPWEIGLAPLPEWLKSLIAQHRQKSSALLPATHNEANAWLSELLDGVGEGERHTALIKLASYYFSRMPYDVSEHLLTEWNEKNDPPISENEFKFQMQDIYKRYSNGEYRSTYQASVQPQLIVPETKPLTPLNLNYFLQGDDSIVWNVHNLIPDKTVTILSGWHGIGKSWVLLDLALEMAKGGGKWLDYLPVTGGNVLYIDEESAMPLLTKRNKKLVAGKGLSHFPMSINFLTGKRFKFTNPSSLERLKQFLMEHKPNLVIVDSLKRVHNLDENSSKDMAYFFDDIIKPLVQEYRCGFIFADHEGKGMPGMNLTGSQRNRGSSAKGDAVDTMISLRQYPQYIVFEHAKARYGKKVPSVAISIDDIGAHATVVRCLGQVGG